MAVATAAGVTIVYIVVVWYSTPGSETNVATLDAELLLLDWTGVAMELGTGVLGTGVLGGTTTAGVVGVSVALLELVA